MRLRAKVTGTTGATKHGRGRLVGDVVVPGVSMGTTARVEIVPSSTGVSLLHYDADGKCIADAWHLTVEEAKGQAAFEFGLTDADWQEVAG